MQVQCAARRLFAVARAQRARCGGEKPPRGALMGGAALKLLNVGFLFTPRIDDSLLTAFC